MRNAEQLEAVYRAIDASRDELIRVLGDLVRAPSVTGHEVPVQDVVEREFAARGLCVDRWEPDPAELAPYRDHVGAIESMAGRPNVVGVRAGSGGGRSILLNGHIDVVDSGDPATWTHPPYSGAVEGDLLYGRGSLDMKGGMATFLLALDALDAVGVQLRGDVTLAATTGEEDGGVGAVATILRGYSADAALITEPTRLALVIACEGSLVFRIAVPGKSAHAAARDEGVSAFEKFIPIFQDLQAFERERNASLRHPLYDEIVNKVPINVGVVRAGVWASTVPESLVAEVRVGFLPGEDMYSFWEQVQARIMAVAEADAWLHEHPPVLEWFGGQFTAADVPADAPIVQAVAAAHKQVTGEQAAIEGVPYGADMRHFIQLGGIPCLMYGAGDVGIAHQANEHISLSEIQTAAKTIATLLIDWCGVA
ncbi:MAG: ArgE/DapE family deacylase [Chloroflexota bacterium]|nr:ArgE/DapE family deacylase [Chloroflexota bacterium]